MLRTSIDLMKENGFRLTKERNRRYPAQTITDADYDDDIALLANTPVQAKTLLHSLELVAGDIGLHVNTDKTEFMCFNQRGNISILKGGTLKLVDKIHLPRKLLIGYRSCLTDKIKRIFSPAAVVSILQYGCTKRMEEKHDRNYSRMLRAILNKSCCQHPTKQQLYSHLLPINKTIQVTRTRHAGHCWRCKDELISDILL